MSEYIRVGHARGPEGSGVSGVPGDQKSGNEVRIDLEYNIVYKNKSKGIKHNYHTLLRPKTDKFPNLANYSALACEAGCDNNYIGYSQTVVSGKGRESLYQEAKKVSFDLSKITTNCNTDCSAFMAVCANAGGIEISPSVYTGNMVAAFVNSGAYDKITDSKYFTSTDYLKRGDILVKNGHTLMILANGSKIPTTEVVPTPSYPDTDISQPSDPADSSNDSQWINDFFAIKIAIYLDEIKANRALAVANLAVVENGEERALNSADKLDLYNWAYTLSSLSDYTIKPGYEKLQIGSSETKISLNNLSPNSSYILKVVAKEKRSKVEFSSPNVIFTTTNNDEIFDKSRVTVFEVENNEAKICNTFLKIKDVFKSVILYNK